MVYAKPRICPRKLDTIIFYSFSDTNGSPDLGQNHQTNH